MKLNLNKDEIKEGEWRWSNKQDEEGSWNFNRCRSNKDEQRRMNVNRWSKKGEEWKYNIYAWSNKLMKNEDGMWRDG